MGVIAVTPREVLDIAVTEKRDWLESIVESVAANGVPLDTKVLIGKPFSGTFLGLEQIAEIEETGDFSSVQWVIDQLRRTHEQPFFLAAGMLNMLCLILAPFVLAILLLYSWAKRFTNWPHLFLGLALGLAPLGAWIAATGRFRSGSCTSSAMLGGTVPGCDRSGEVGRGYRLAPSHRGTSGSC